MGIKPEFITFTGVDEKTSIEGLHDLHARYPVEFGILLSEVRQGKDEHPRFPRFSVAEDFLEYCDDIKFAGHLCGDMARNVTLTGHYPDFYLGEFSRIQINVSSLTKKDLLYAAALGEEIQRPIIFQTRDTFPYSGSIEAMLAQWLFDASGGRGVEPEVWPTYHGDTLVGYAGGINPENVVRIVESIVAGSLAATFQPPLFWIDMESGVRTDDWFDLDKCRAVCEAVYGKDYVKP